jgi:hypothetical protein
MPVVVVVVPSGLRTTVVPASWLRPARTRNLPEIRAQIGIIGDAERNGRAIEAAQEQPRAELLRGAVGQLDDHRLDQHLLAPHVELADHLAQHLLHVLRGRDDDRVGALEPGHLRHCGKPAALRRPAFPRPAAASAHPRRAVAASRRWSVRSTIRCSAAAPAAARTGAGEAVILERLGIARLLAQQHLQHRQQLRRIGMFQIDDAHIRPACRALVELGRDRRQPRQGRCVPRSATELALSIGTTDTPSGASPLSAWASSRGPMLSTPITRVDVRSTATSISRSTWRTRRTLSAKSDTTTELRLAVMDPSRLISGRNVSIACAGSMLRTRKISVTKVLPERRCDRPIGAEEAAPATGWTRSAPPDVGTATKPFARSVDRNSSKYSDRLSGRSATTDTRPCTDGSMMMVRPVTRAAA